MNSMDFSQFFPTKNGSKIWGLSPRNPGGAVRPRKSEIENPPPRSRDLCVSCIRDSRPGQVGPKVVSFFWMQKMGCWTENSGFLVPPNIIHFNNRVFHEINHPFWGFVSLFLETPKMDHGNTPLNRSWSWLAAVQSCYRAPSRKRIVFQANFPSISVNEDGTAPPEVLTYRYPKYSNSLNPEIQFFARPMIF